MIALSNEQKILREKLNTVTSQEQKDSVRIKRNKKDERINKKKIQEIENQILLEEIEEIESCKDDSNRMYKAIRKFIRSKPIEAIVVETENGNTTNEEESTKIITDCFKRVFKAENQTKNS